MEPHLDALLPRFINRLHSSESRILQENCLSGIAVIAEASGEEQFRPYYPQIMPMLKQVVTKCSKPEERTLQGKAFECISLVGLQVGKATFGADAVEVMTAMLQLLKGGVESDDPRRNSFMEASAQIAKALGSDFKPFAQDVLLFIFKVLEQRPAEKAGATDDDDSDAEDENLKTYGLRTTVLEEMEEALDLANTLIKSLGDDFVEFLPATCRSLLEFANKAVSEELLLASFETWEHLVAGARSAAENNKLSADALRELVTEFLKKSVGAMLTAANDPKVKRDKDDNLPEALCTTLHTQAAGIAGVVRQAGTGVLSKEGVKDLTEVVVKMIDAMRVPAKASAEPGPRRRRGGPVVEEDSDGDEKEEEEDEMVGISEQSVRFALVDMLGALMRSSPEASVELALPTLMQLVKLLVRPDGTVADRSLGFYLADDMVGILGDKTVPYWNAFMNEALLGMLDAEPIIRQYCASTIGNGAAASQQAFAQVVPAACSTIHKVLQKFGERHRRRRAVKVEMKMNALAVDACIRALGQLCQTHEASMGSDAGTAWGMWLSSLPIKYNADAGKAAHHQLLDLVMANHGYLAAPAQLPKLMTVLTELFKAKFSSEELDKKIAVVVASLPEEALKALREQLPDKSQKKVMQMLKMAAA
eukprot:SRR837773.4887.p2 GENE.SRR837773.4887~~SRR837773.4887.p2  ORF type:complete len:713 (-),score=367.03 SRR837773.4887:122-2062(-)